MRSILFFIIVGAFINAHGAESDKRFEGYIFTYLKNDYITAHLGTTYPQFRIYWRDARVRREICISSKPGTCPSYILSYRQEKNQNGDFVFANAQIVSPFDDPKTHLEYMKNMNR